MKNSFDHLVHREETTLEIREQINKYLHFWPWFVISALALVMSTFIYIRYRTQNYYSTATVKILSEHESNQVADLVEINPLSPFVNVENEIAMFRSYRLLEQVARQENLVVEFFNIGKIQTSETEEIPFQLDLKVAQDRIKNQNYLVSFQEDGFTVLNEKNEEKIPFKSTRTHETIHELPFEIRLTQSPDITKTPIRIRLRSLQNVTTRLQETIEVYQIGKKSDLIGLTLLGPLKNKTERTLNRLIKIYNEDGVKDKQHVDKRTIDFIDTRFASLTKELNEIEISKKEFKQKNNLLDLENNFSIDYGLRREADEDLFELENQLLLAEMIKESLVVKNNDLLPGDIGLENKVINNLVNAYNAKVIERNKLLNSGGTNNPNVKFLNNAIKELKSILKGSIEDYRKQLSQAKQQMELRSNKLKNDFASLPSKEKQLREIERKQKIKESLFLLLLERKELASIQLAVTEPIIKVVDYALSSIDPIGLKKSTIYLGSFLLGLFIPFIILYVFFSLNNKVQTRKDLTKIIPNARIIGEIPEIPRSLPVLFSNPNDRSALAESARILSANIGFVLPKTRENKGSVILCTSSIKSEGKSFISMNLSLAFASMNKKVLLIGSDLRNPQLHKYVKTKKEVSGLVDYLRGANDDWKNSVLTAFENYPDHNTLVSGILPPTPSQLLSNGRIEKLLEEAREIYDYIVIDSAPTLLVTDTFLVSQLADVTAYIIRADKTDKVLLDYFKDITEQEKLKNVSFVLNGMGAKSAYSYSYAYGYGYSYNYGYGYGYGEKKRNKKGWKTLFKS